MIHKTKILLFFIFIFMISVGVVNASGNLTISDELTNSTDFTISSIQDEDATFTQLNDDINIGDSQIKLTKNYRIGEGESHVVITRSNIVIDGQGHTLDAKSSSRIFYIDDNVNNIVLKNFVFINSNSDNGAVLYVSEAINNLTIQNCSFKDNSATNGGAIYFNDAVSNLTIINSTFVSNSVTNNGGAVYFNGDASDISFINVIANDNKGTEDYNSYGGVLFFNTGISNLLINNSSFYNNLVYHSGGVLWVRNAANDIKIYNSNFTKNKAGSKTNAGPKDYRGGAFYFNGAISNLYIINDTFDNNHVEARRHSYGGAIFFNGAITNGIIDSKFVNNYAQPRDTSYDQSNYGGAIFFNGVVSKVSIFGYFSNNRVYATGKNYNEGVSGGALYINSIKDSIINATFDKNYAHTSGGTRSGYGGAIYISTSSNTIISGNYYGNYATGYASKGGAIYIHNNVNGVEIYNANFYSNSALEGGAIFMAGSSNIISKSIFENNKATNGGAIYVNNELTISDNIFSSNSATNGSSIYCSFKSNINNNIFMKSDYKGTNNIVDGYIYSNVELLLENNTSTFTDFKTILDNAVDILEFNCNYKYFEDYDSFSQEAFQISKPMIINGNGNAIDANYDEIRLFTISADNVILNNITFKNSRLNSSGNAVLANNPVNITYCTFMDNWASGQFGGAVNLNADNSNITYCVFTGNKALTGAGIVVNSNNNHIQYSYFKNNSRNYGGTMNYGDDISISGGKSAYVNYNMLLDNRPLRQGSAEYYYNNWYGQNSLPDSSSSGSPNIPNYLIASFDAVFTGKTNDLYNYLFKLTFSRSDNEEVVDLKTSHVYTVYDDLGDFNITGGSTVNLSNKFYVNKVSVNLGNIVLTKDFGIGSESGTFTDLNKLISEAKEHSTINLLRDYVFTSGVDSDAVAISKTITINGNGHIINAAKSTNIFKITGNNVVLKNMTLTNAYVKNVNYMGVSVLWSGNNGLMNNVTISSNTFDSSGSPGSYNWWDSGMIYWSGENGNVNNTKFISNTVASSKGIIIWTGFNGTVNNSYFYGCSNTYNSGVGYSQATSFFIYWDAGEGKILNTVLQNLKVSTRDVSNPYYVSFTNPGYVSNVSFISCQASNRGKTLYNLNLPFSPVEDYVKDFTGTFQKQTPYITLSNNVFTVNAVRSGTVSYTIDGSSSKTAQVDENGHFILDFDKSKNHYIKVTYNQNSFYNSVTSYFNYDSATGCSAWYVNGAATSTGSGLSTSPFKTLKNAINYANTGDIIYIAAGTYAGSNNIGLTISKSLNICRWGDSGDVIFDAKSTSNIFTVNSIVNLTSLVFKNGVSDFGGAITFNNIANIIDCTFINNNARYGGAVNVASNVEVSFNNSRFIQNTASLGGGAIYSWGGTVHVYNSIFNQSLSDYGGAIFSLEGNLILTNDSFYNNQGLSFGGGIYVRSGQLTINKGYFSNNTAYYDGGAAYISHGLSNIENTIFVCNIAGYGGGALHSLAGTLILKKNTFINNISSSLNGWIDTKYLNSFIDFANYTLIVADTSNFDGTIPSYFSLPDNGWDTSVKNQGSLGICWDYATIVMVETAVKKATGIELDLSEGNLKNLLSKYADYGWGRNPNDGGGRWDGCSYLSNSLGPILESADPTGAYGFSPLLGNVIHISNIPIVVRSRDDPLANDEIKEIIMKYGAIKASMYAGASNGYNYYQNTTTGTNHAVAIVGWDDNYSKNNFNNNCPGDGAWIVKNSWGQYSGKNGYIYISYYDTSFAWGNLYYIIFNDTVQYSRVYQYDYGNYGMKSSGGSVSWYKNTYTSVKNEGLSAFSTYFNAKSEWEVYVYVENELKHTQNGSSISSGYFTFNFDKIIPIAKGDEFTIVFKVNNKYFPYVGKNLNTVTCGAGVSYYSKDGITWNDLNNNKQVACLKVFTQNMPGSSVSIDSIVNVTYNSIITVNFNVENRTVVNYYVTNKNGLIVANGTGVIANKIILSNLDAGDYTVIISNQHSNKYIGDVKSANFTINKAKSSISIEDIESVIYGNTVNVNFVSVNATNLSYTVKNKSNGEIVVNKTTISDNFIIQILDAGDYVVTVSNDETANYLKSEAFAQFKIVKAISDIMLSVSDVVYSENVVVNVKSSVGGLYVVGVGGQSRSVSLTAGEWYSVDFGVLGANNYDVIVSYDETANYNSNSKKTNLVVFKAKSSVGISDISQVIYPDKINVEFNVVNSTTVTYFVKTVSGNVVVSNSTLNGFNRLILPLLDAGDYVISIANSENENYTGDFASAQFKIVKATPDIMLSVSDVVYSENVVVNVKSSVGGLYVVDVGNQSRSVNLTADERYYIEFDNLAANTYEVVVSYDETANYKSLSKKSSVVVFKAKSGVSISDISQVTYSEDVVVDFNVVNPTAVTYIVKTTLNEVIISNSTLNGFNRLILPLLDAGDYVISIANSENENYTGDFASAQFKIVKATPDIMLSVSDVVYSENVVVNVKSNVGGLYVVDVGGQSRSVNLTADGWCSIDFGVLGANTYEVVVSYDETANYKSLSKKSSVVVFKAKSSVSISDISQVTYPDKINVEFNVVNSTTVTYIVKTTLNEVIISNSTLNGFNRLILPLLDAGDYVITIANSENENYAGGIKSSQFKVVKANSTLNLPTSFEYNWDSGSIDVDYDLANGVDVVVVGHSEAVITVKDKKITISNLVPDSYALNVTTIVDKNHNSVSKVVKFNVNPIPSELNEIGDVEFDYNSSVNVNVHYGGSTGVTASIMNHSEAKITIIDGQIIIANLDAGIYTLNVSTIADNNHTSVYKTVNVKVSKISSELSIHVTNDTYPNNVSITVKSKIDGLYQISINSTVYNMSVINGIGTISIKKSANIYNASVNLAESKNYNASTAYCIFRVSKNSIYEYTASLNQTVLYSNPISLFANAPDDATGKVTFTDLSNNQILGSCDINTKLTLKTLDCGVYLINASYAGDSNYKSNWKIIKLTVTAIEDNAMITTFNNYTYGSYTAIKTVVNKYSDASGTIVYYIDDKKVAESLIGEEIIISNLKVGKHIVKIAYQNDVNYEFENITKTLIVKPAGSSINSRDIEVKYTTDRIYINFTSINATEIEYGIYKNNSQLIIGNVSADENINIDCLDVGDYIFTLTTIVDENHTSSTKEYSLKIIKNNIDLNVVLNSVSYQNDLIVKITSNVTGKYHVNIPEAGFSQDIDLTADKEYEINLGVLPVNHYAVNVTSLVSNYETVSQIKTAEVLKGQINLTLSVDNVVYPGALVLKMKSNVTGKYMLIVDEVGINHEINLNDNIENITLINLNAGNYTVYLKNTDYNYETVCIEKKIQVFKADPCLSLEIINVTYPDNVSILVKSKVDGIYQLSINSTIYNVTVLKGIGTKNIKKSANIYNATLIFKGNDNFEDSNVSTLFEVYKNSDYMFNAFTSKSVILYGESILLENVINIDYDAIVKYVDLDNLNVLAISGTNQSVLINNLSSKHYKINATFEGNENYESKWMLIEFDVKKAPSYVMSCDIEVEYSGKPVSLNILSQNATNVLYHIYDVNAKEVLNGMVGADENIVLNNLNVGRYSINLTTVCDLNHSSVSRQYEISIIEGNIDINVECEDAIFKNPIAAKIYVNVSGNYTIVIGEVYNKTCELKTGENIINDISQLNVGNYTIEITSKIDNYRQITKSKQFNVIAGKINIDLETSNTTYPDDLIIKIRSDVDGEYLIKINEDLKTTVNLKSGEYKTVNLGKNPVNSYKISVISNITNYERKTVEKIVDVKPQPVTLSISVNDVDYSNNVTAFIKANIEGLYTIHVKGTNITKKVQIIKPNDVVSVNLGILAVKKNYNITVTNMDNYQNYTLFSVNPTESMVDDIGEFEFNYSQTKTLKINYQYALGINASIVNNSQANLKITNNIITISNLNAGNYILNITTIPDENHTSISETVKFTVNPIDITISVYAPSVKIGENPKITVSTDATGIVELTFINETYVINLTANEKSATLPVCSLGSHNVFVNYLGDLNYKPYQSVLAFNVLSYGAFELQKTITEAISNNQSEINLTHDYVFGENDECIIVNEHVKINGNNHIIDANNLQSIFYIIGDNVELNNLTLTNANDSAIIWMGQNGVLNNTKLINNTAINGGAVRIFGNNMSIENSEFINNSASLEGGAIYVISDNVKIYASKFYKNTARSGAAISLKGKNMTVSHSIFSNNTIDDSLSGIAVGDNITVTVDSETRKNSDAVIDLKQSAIVVESLETDNSGVTISLKIKSGEYPVFDGNVSLTLNGNNYCCDVNNGLAIIKIDNLHSGVYNNILIEYNGSDYYNSSNTWVNFTLNKSDKDVGFKIISNFNYNVFYLELKKYSVKVINSNGALVKGVNVKFTIDGSTYSARSDAKGYATININLKPGIHTITSQLNGYKTTNKINVKHIIKAKKTTNIKKSVKSTIIKITIKGHNIIQSKKVKFNYDGKKTVKVKFGKVMKKQTVTVKFKGKTYKVKVNKKGIGKFKLTKKLKKGKKYNVKVTYKAQKVYKKVKVSIKFNGKIYKVKTNKNGIAKFKITKKMIKNIKKGKKVKYIITYKKDSINRFVKIK